MNIQILLNYPTFVKFQNFFYYLIKNVYYKLNNEKNLFIDHDYVFKINEIIKFTKNLKLKRDPFNDYYYLFKQDKDIILNDDEYKEKINNITSISFEDKFNKSKLLNLLNLLNKFFLLLKDKYIQSSSSKIEEFEKSIEKLEKLKEIELKELKDFSSKIKKIEKSIEKLKKSNKELKEIELKEIELKKFSSKIKEFEKSIEKLEKELNVLKKLKDLKDFSNKIEYIKILIKNKPENIEKLYFEMEKIIKIFEIIEKEIYKDQEFNDLINYLIIDIINNKNKDFNSVDKFIKSYENYKTNIFSFFIKYNDIIKIIKVDINETIIPTSNEISNRRNTENYENLVYFMIKIISIIIFFDINTSLRTTLIYIIKRLHKWVNQILIYAPVKRYLCLFHYK